MAIPKIQPYALADVETTPVNRADWQLDPARAVLLVHDMQNYFLDFYDRDREPITELLPNIRRLRDVCKEVGVPVVYTAQPGNQSPHDRALLTDFWGTGLADDAHAQAIDAGVQPDGDDRQYTKWRYSAFQRTPLHDFMREEGRDQLIVCGVYAHIGILATSLEAFMSDIQTFVVGNAVADFSAAEQSMALNYVAQRCGVVALLDNAIAMLRNAAHAPTSDPSKLPLNLATMKLQIADSLGISVDEVGDDDNLMYLGLDSIRLMSLLETWREIGADVSFTELAESTSVGTWWALIEQRLATDAPAGEVRRRA
ncbi:isochorismatase family protein [Thiosocius teredinicola]|uniref:isochorismatase family protein n=1 Tax=Thiosocius teredinicola TaxID=1973002 RepID=UPI0009913231